MPADLPLAPIEQPYSPTYFTEMATFIHHAPFHIITPIMKAPTAELLDNVLERVRHEPTALPVPSKMMDDTCTVLAYGLDMHKHIWGVTHGVITLTLLLLWRFRYAREDGKGRDEKGAMAEDYIWVVTAVARAITSITDAKANLTTWSELTCINKSDLRVAFTAFDNALEHRFLVTEAQYDDWTWRADRIWGKHLTVSDSESS